MKEPANRQYCKLCARDPGQSRKTRETEPKRSVLHHSYSASGCSRSSASSSSLDFCNSPSNSASRSCYTRCCSCCNSDSFPTPRRALAAWIPPVTPSGRGSRRRVGLWSWTVNTWRVGFLDALRFQRDEKKQLGVERRGMSE